MLCWRPLAAVALRFIKSFTLMPISFQEAECVTFGVATFAQWFQMTLWVSTHSVPPFCLPRSIWVERLSWQSCLFLFHGHLLLLLAFQQSICLFCLSQCLLSGDPTVVLSYRQNSMPARIHFCFFWLMQELLMLFQLQALPECSSSSVKVRLDKIIRDLSSLPKHSILVISRFPQTLFQSLPMQTQIQKVLYNTLRLAPSKFPQSRS